MLKLNANLTPFLDFFRRYRDSSVSIHHIINAITLSEFQAISVFCGPDDLDETKALIHHIRAYSGIDINIYLALDTHDPSVFSQDKVTMITFCHAPDPITFDPEPIQPETVSDLDSLIETVKSAGQFAGTVISPRVKNVKDAGRLPIDCLHFSFSEINRVSSYAEEQELMEQFRQSLIAADKFGFGNMVLGHVQVQTMQTIQRQLDGAHLIEEAVINRALFDRCMIDGIQSTLAYFTDRLRG